MQRSRSGSVRPRSWASSRERSGADDAERGADDPARINTVESAVRIHATRLAGMSIPRSARVRRGWLEYGSAAVARSVRVSIGLAVSTFSSTCVSLVSWCLPSHDLPFWRDELAIPVSPSVNRDREIELRLRPLRVLLFQPASTNCAPGAAASRRSSTSSSVSSSMSSCLKGRAKATTAQYQPRTSSGTCRAGARPARERFRA